MPIRRCGASQDVCTETKPLIERGRRGGGRSWIALAVNAGMFLAEIVAGVAAGSASLQADALDFLGDAANYAISLASPAWRWPGAPAQRC